MSEKPEAPEKKAKTNSHIPETEDLPAPLGPQQATSRKRKAERAVDREPPVHARHHPVHAEPMTREERPSDRELASLDPTLFLRKVRTHSCPYTTTYDGASTTEASL
jgi:hypothetical protein